ncbi:MAG: hypothetical protein KGR26_06485, partial [Cyanobacteria bacterium REEB65]|nr:hypothetical protein [Cyanobacteria bacterium REEB65]
FEDVDLGWRLWVLGYRVGFCGQAVSYHRHNGTSSRFGLHKKMVLMERNALYTMLKNYDDERCRGLLPAALLLAYKRISVRSGVDRHWYDFVPVPKGRRIWSKLRDASRQGGLKAVVKLGLIQVATRILARFSSGAPVAVKPEAYSTVVALEDLLDHLPEVLAKRREIQARRKRSDREILQLFHLPFHPIDPTPSYVQAHDNVMAAFDLRQYFEMPVEVGL